MPKKYIWNAKYTIQHRIEHSQTTECIQYYIHETKSCELPKYAFLFVLVPTIVIKKSRKYRKNTHKKMIHIRRKFILFIVAIFFSKITVFVINYFFFFCCYIFHFTIALKNKTNFLQNGVCYLALMLILRYFK